MKNRLFSIVSILVLSATLATAQDQPKISFGILGGVNLQNLTGKAYNGSKLDNDMMLGYNVGVNARIPIASRCFFQPGLMFSVKGDKNKSAESTSTTKFNYLEMPLNMGYKTSLGSGSVTFGFGPYIAYALGGKVKTEGSSATVEYDIEFKNTVEAGDLGLVKYYKHLDAGANIFAGYEMTSGLFVQLNAQFGMLKINPEYKEYPEDKAAEKNTGFGLSAGYRF